MSLWSELRPIAARVGVTPHAIYARMRKGLPLDMPRRASLSPRSCRWCGRRGHRVSNCIKRPRSRARQILARWTGKRVVNGVVALRLGITGVQAAWALHALGRQGLALKVGRGCWVIG